MSDLRPISELAESEVLAGPVPIVLMYHTVPATFLFGRALHGPFGYSLHFDIAAISNTPWQEFTVEGNQPQFVSSLSTQSLNITDALEGGPESSYVIASGSPLHVWYDEQRALETKAS